MPVLTPGPTVLLFPGEEVIFHCNTTADAVQWLINGQIHTESTLPAGHYTFNLTTVIVNMTMNDSTYTCGTPIGLFLNLSNAVNVLLAG